MLEKEKKNNGVSSSKKPVNLEDVKKSTVTEPTNPVSSEFSEDSEVIERPVTPEVIEEPKEVMQEEIETSEVVEKSEDNANQEKEPESRPELKAASTTDGVPLSTEERIAKLEDNAEKQREKEKKQKRKIIARNITILALIIIIILLLLRSCSANVQMDVTPEIERMVYDIPEKYDVTEHEDGKVAVMGWNEGEKVISMKNPALVLKNVSANLGHYYLQFTVKEGDKELYKSGLVAPASMIAPDFPKDMSLGEHDVIVSVTAFAIDDTSKQLSTTNIALKIIMTE